ncbi:hypothetical protein PIROE2DRAFT_18601 [Piromyces sp. E2]|nr:hypothetical protein PIROE2DRAFT_18601 [Piromyces sp. E2]|eukprot:OUM56679.1 hypothetical protein PIROE2DRAFT_18601 [Piromyces sp. E2]
MKISNIFTFLLSTNNKNKFDSFCRPNNFSDQSYNLIYFLCTVVKKYKFSGDFSMGF